MPGSLPDVLPDILNDQLIENQGSQQSSEIDIALLHNSSFTFNGRSVSGRAIRILSGSLEQLLFRYNGAVGQDPSGTSFSLALFDPGSDDPSALTWAEGQWIYDNTLSAWDLSLLVGPGGDLTPEPGRYDVRVRYTDIPEAPILTIFRAMIV